MEHCEIFSFLFHPKLVVIKLWLLYIAIAAFPKTIRGRKMPGPTLGQ